MSRRDAAGWGALAGAAILASLMVARAGSTPVINGGSKWLVDWQTYAAAVDHFLAGRPVYSAAQLAGPYHLDTVVRLGYAYPPPSLLLFVPFAQPNVGLLGWMALNVGLLFSGLAAILRRELGHAAPWPLAVVTFGLALFVPFADGIASGNANVAIAGLLAWCWAEPRWMASASGFAAVVKIYPGLLSIWPARSSGVLSIVIAALVPLALSLLTLPMFGLGMWADFLRALGNSQPLCGDAYAHISLACLVEPIAGVSVAKVIGIPVALALAGGALVIRDRLFAFVCLGFALLAPVTDMHDHYWLVVFVLLVAACVRVLGRRRLVLPQTASADNETSRVPR